jgi:hypothetical protein
VLAADRFARKIVGYFDVILCSALAAAEPWQLNEALRAGISAP